MTFSVGPAGGTAGRFTGELKDGRLVGDYAYGGLSSRTEAGRPYMTEAHETPQPEFPRLPTPYETKPVSFRNGGILLAAGLTLPSGPGPHPAIVLVGGSGGDVSRLDAPGSLDNVPPGIVWTDRLARAGIAVLHMDSRGAGGSSGSKENSTLSELADDVVVAVRWLGSCTEVDRARLGLIGVSQGADVSLLASRRSEGVHFPSVSAAAEYRWIKTTWSNSGGPLPPTSGAGTTRTTQS